MRIVSAVVRTGETGTPLRDTVIDCPTTYNASAVLLDVKTKIIIGYINAIPAFNVRELSCGQVVCLATSQWTSRWLCQIYVLQSHSDSHTKPACGDEIIHNFAQTVGVERCKSCKS